MGHTRYRTSGGLPSGSAKREAGARWLDPSVGPRLASSALGPARGAGGERVVGRDCERRAGPRPVTARQSKCCVRGWRLQCRCGLRARNHARTDAQFILAASAALRDRDQNPPGGFTAHRDRHHARHHCGLCSNWHGGARDFFVTRWGGDGALRVESACARRYAAQVGVVVDLGKAVGSIGGSVHQGRRVR